MRLSIALAACWAALIATGNGIAYSQLCGEVCEPDGLAFAPCLGLGAVSGLKVRAEYLLWWTDGMWTPPLVTTSLAGTPRDQAGVLGQPGTSVLYGNGAVNGDAHSGGRFSVGGGFDPERLLGFELIYAFLGQDTGSFQAASAGNPILARPFVSADDGLQDAGLTAFPGVAEGSLAIDAATRFQTAEALLTKVLFEQCDQRVAWSLGYRYAALKDDLRLAETIISRVPGTASSRLDLFDQFTTKNTFHGPQLGILAERRGGAWTMEYTAKLAIGSRRSEVVIAGATTATAGPDDVTTTPEGFYALATNSGRYEQDSFSGLTELGVRLSRELGCGWRASLGYSFLYWYYVARAGDQIDTTLSPNDFPPDAGNGSLHPRFPFTTRGFWAQGLNVGAEWRF